jgi:hypothetical protein
MSLGGDVAEARLQGLRQGCTRDRRLLNLQDVDCRLEGVVEHREEGQADDDK